MKLARPNSHFNNETGAAVKRTLASLSIILPLLSCHVNNSYGVPSRQGGIPSSVNKIEGLRQDPNCQVKGLDIGFKAPDGRVIVHSKALRDGEKVQELVCLDNRAFVLTDRSLIIVTAAGLDENDGDMRLDNVLSRTDMTDLLKSGLVAWAQSREACYFLTRDRKLTIMPNEEGDTAQYSVPFDTAGMRKDRMAFHSGFLFIAPDDRSVYVYKLAGQKGAKMVPVITKAAEPGFFLSKGVLFFGKKGEDEKKIEITGTDLGNVKIH